MFAKQNVMFAKLSAMKGALRTLSRHTHMHIYFYMCLYIWQKFQISTSILKNCDISSMLKIRYINVPVWMNLNSPSPLELCVITNAECIPGRSSCCTWNKTKSHLFASLMNMAEYDRAEGLTAIPFWFNGAKELGCSGYCILSPWSFANSWNKYK